MLSIYRFSSFPSSSHITTTTTTSTTTTTTTTTTTSATCVTVCHDPCPVLPPLSMLPILQLSPPVLKAPSLPSVFSRCISLPNSSSLCTRPLLSVVWYASFLQLSFLHSLEVSSQFNLPQLFWFHDTLFKVQL